MRNVANEFRFLLRGGDQALKFPRKGIPEIQTFEDDYTNG